MKKIIKILLSITIGLIYSQNIDTILFSRSVINDKAILVPDYEIESSEFVIEYLDKRKFFFIDFHIGYIDNDDTYRLNLSPSLNLKNLKFKINLDYAFNSDSLSFSNIDDVFSFFERIEYFKYSFFDHRVNLYLGEIRNFTIGHGYLVNNYNNTLNYPLSRKLGFIMNLTNSNQSVKYDLFISNLRDLINKGGIVANKFTFLFSNDFPLTFGFGHITDLNQFSKFDDIQLDFDRKVDAFQGDFTFPIMDNTNEKLYLIGEICGIDYPEKRFYIRVDDDQFTNDKKSRNGIWGIAFPGMLYNSDNVKFKLTANYNSAVYTPYYFNSTYDFENIRFRQYNIQENEALYEDEAELLQQFATSNSTLYVPKDMYGMINQAENTYPTFGFSTNLDLKINKHNNFSFHYSFFKNISEVNNSFYNTFMFNSSNFIKIVYFPTKFDIYFSKNFFKASQYYNYDENLAYGFSLDMMLYESIYLIGSLKHVFYDINYDGKIDLVPYVNIGLNYKY